MPLAQCDKKTGKIRDIRSYFTDLSIKQEDSGPTLPVSDGIIKQEPNFDPLETQPNNLVDVKSENAPTVAVKYRIG
jgi:hypothetical protein